jgi:tripeptidyl-peptidase I
MTSFKLFKLTLPSQINEERFAIGKGPVGFVNPILYAFPWILNDITNGTNLGCGTQGFHAARG